MASSSFSRRVPSSLLNPQLQSRAAASIARKRSRSAVGAIAAPPYAAHLPRLLAARYVGIQLGAQNLVQTPARLYSSNASPISSGAADMFHGLARLDQTPARLFSSTASLTNFNCNGNVEVQQFGYLDYFRRIRVRIACLYKQADKKSKSQCIR